MVHTKLTAYSLTVYTSITIGKYVCIPDSIVSYPISQIEATIINHSITVIKTSTSDNIV